jgi:hypothetical protein
MDSDAYSDQSEPGGTGESWGAEPSVAEPGEYHDYWKRRFYILAGGLAVVGGITWGLSAVLGPARPVSVGGRASLAVRDSLPAVAYGAASGRPGPAATPAGAATSASPAAPGSPSPSPAALPGASPSPSAGTGPGGTAGRCPPESIVLSLFTSQSRYGPGQPPRFEVYAVSTAPGTCDLAYGPSVVRVVVTRAGQVIWDSAACKARASAAAKPVRLAPGVPEVAVIAWDRQASPPGCAGSLPAGASGTFDAVAMADGRSSAVRAFTLSRR